MDAEEPLFAPLRQKIVAAQRERDVRQQRLKFFVRAAQSLAAIVIVGATVAFFLIRAQRDRALVAEHDATSQRDRALVAERDATSQRDRAMVAEEEAKGSAKRAMEAEVVAEDQRDAARDAEKVATEQRDRAQSAEKTATEQRDRAQAAEKAEALLREQEEYEAYIATIGLVSAKIDENAFGFAGQVARRVPFDVAELGVGGG